VSGNLRHNLAALGADYALFVVGLAFASQSTILPAFAVYLGAPNVVIGAIPAVMTLGWFMPSLFAAGHTETLERKLPFVVRHTIWERVPFVVLALAAFFLADRAPALTLGVMLLVLLVVTGVGGVLMPAWMDLIGRVVPVTLRGRFLRRIWRPARGAGGQRRDREHPGDGSRAGQLRLVLPVDVRVPGALVRCAGGRPRACRGLVGAGRAAPQYLARDPGASAAIRTRLVSHRARLRRSGIDRERLLHRTRYGVDAPTAQGRRVHHALRRPDGGQHAARVARRPAGIAW
jgi:hypothetical protein